MRKAHLMREFHLMHKFHLAMAAILFASGSSHAADIPGAVAAPGATLILQVHAEGAQIYECVADSGGEMKWQFREPIATLIRDGKTVGRHFAGPTWEATDGSAVIGKVVGKAPGATGTDIPWLKLDVSDRRGEGLLSTATIVQRLDTRGGSFEGACAKAGIFHAEPYSAEYVFLKP